MPIKDKGLNPWIRVAKDSNEAATLMNQGWEVIGSRINPLYIDDILHQFTYTLLAPLPLRIKLMNEQINHDVVHENAAKIFNQLAKDD